jgi:hypothetical protein
MKIWILTISEFDTETYYDVEDYAIPFTSPELAKRYAEGYIARWCISKYDLPVDYQVEWENDGAPEEGMFNITLVRDIDETGHQFFISAKELDPIYRLTVIETV